MNRLSQIKNSFSHAISGLVYVAKTEKNFQLELGFATLVVAAMVYFNVTRPEMIVLFIIIIGVLVMELLNTIMERVVDILKPRIHPYARLIKDIMAASVLMSSILAVIIGCIIFIPYIVK